MSDVKRLLDEATPLPWRRSEDEFDREWHFSGKSRKGMPWSSFAIVYGFDDDDDTDAEGEANAQLVEYAVNRLPDYEAAVDALVNALTFQRARWNTMGGPWAGPAIHAIDEALADPALARLREKVPA